jgi:hypothetical protein
MAMKTDQKATMLERQYSLLTNVGMPMLVVAVILKDRIGWVALLADHIPSWVPDAMVFAGLSAWLVAASAPWRNAAHGAKGGLVTPPADRSMKGTCACSSCYPEALPEVRRGSEPLTGWGYKATRTANQGEKE